MSTAAPFVYNRSFPFCASDIASSVSADETYISNLTLDQVMGFFWNFETFTITTSGSVTKGANTVSADCDITLDPVGSTVRAYAAVLDYGDWFDAGAPTSPTLFASFPRIRSPSARVCHTDGVNVSKGTMLSMRWSNDSTDLIDNCSFVSFFVGTDPSNPGKYRIYYRFRFNFKAGSGATLREMEINNDNDGVGYTAITNGSISLAGISGFSWYSFYSGDSYTGGTVSATSGSFTY